MVLDACSAPGNKTVHLAALTRGKGKIIACELNKDRIKRLEETVRLSGATNIEVLHGDFLSLDPNDPSLSKVRAIRLDPSCSGSGTAAQRLDHLFPSHATANDTDTERLSKLSAFPKKALAHALSFPAVEKVVYSTCSINQIENEDVVSSVLPLAASLDFQLATPFPQWSRRGFPVVEGAEHLLRTDPIEDKEGFFITLFIKKGSNGNSELTADTDSPERGPTEMHCESCSCCSKKTILMPVLFRGCFGQMPLHKAAMLGHLEFTTAILDQKPELAKHLDSRRWSPLHLASANRHLQVVKALLLVDPDMCFAQDADGWSPLHAAVIKDRVEVLKELVLAKAESVLVPGEGGETLLHLCVKQSHLNALKFFVEFVNGMDYGVLNSKDNDGLTVLHMAVARRQVEIVNFLLVKASIEVNSLNANGSTALDISLAQCQRKAKDINIQDSLLQAGAISVKYAFSTGCKLEADNTRDSSSTFRVHIRTLRNSRVKNSKKHHKRKNNNLLENKRNALMVVASLNCQ